MSVEWPVCTYGVVMGAKVPMPRGMKWGDNLQPAEVRDRFGGFTGSMLDEKGHVQSCELHFERSG